MQRSVLWAIRCLHIHSGSDVDYQKTVGNLPLQLVGIVQRLFGLGGKRRIDILQGLDGVVHAGELLVVLGMYNRWHPAPFQTLTPCEYRSSRQRMLHLPQNRCRRNARLLRRRQIIPQLPGDYPETDAQELQGRGNLYRRSGCALSQSHSRSDPIFCSTG